MRPSTVVPMSSVPAIILSAAAGRWRCRPGARRMRCPMELSNRAHAILPTSRSWVQAQLTRNVLRSIHSQDLEHDHGPLPPVLIGNGCCSSLAPCPERRLPAGEPAQAGSLRQFTQPIEIAPSLLRRQDEASTASSSVAGRTSFAAVTRTRVEAAGAARPVAHAVAQVTSQRQPASQCQPRQPAPRPLGPPAGNAWPRSRSADETRLHSSGAAIPVVRADQHEGVRRLTPAGAVEIERATMVRQRMQNGEGIVTGLDDFIHATDGAALDRTGERPVLDMSPLVTMNRPTRSARQVVVAADGYDAASQQFATVLDGRVFPHPVGP